MCSFTVKIIHNSTCRGKKEVKNVENKLKRLYCGIFDEWCFRTDRKNIFFIL